MDFESEITRHRAVLLNLAMKYTRNPADAEDLVQDTVVRALGAWASFEGTSARPWLCCMMRNLFLNGVRRAVTHATAHPEDVAALNHSAANRTQPEIAGFSDEVKAAAETLTADASRILDLADVQGWEYKEIAGALDLPIGTVMSRLHRARAKMRASLTGHALNAGIVRSARRRIGVRSVQSLDTDRKDDTMSV